MWTGYWLLPLKLLPLQLLKWYSATLEHRGRGGAGG